MTNKNKSNGSQPKKMEQVDPDLSGLQDISLVPMGGSEMDLTLAQALQRLGSGLIDVKDREEPVSAMQYLAEMLWAFVVSGRATYTDGVEVRVPNNDQWLKIAKWVVERMEGPPPKEVHIKKTQTVTKIDLSSYSIEDLARLKTLAERIQGVENG